MQPRDDAKLFLVPSDDFMAHTWCKLSTFCALNTTVYAFFYAVKLNLALCGCDSHLTLIHFLF